MDTNVQPLLTLAVLSGRHAGAKQVISAPKISIGSSFASDLLLTDPLIWPTHATLNIGDGIIEVEATAGEVVLNDHVIALHSSGRARLPCRLRVGDVELDLSPVRTKFDFSSFSSPASIALALCLVVGGALLLVAQGGKSGLRARLTAPALSAADNSPPKSGNSSPSADQPTAEAAAEALRQYLQPLKISSIDATARSGVVIANGTIPSSVKEAWRGAQIWFDETYGRHLVLQSEVTVSDPSVPQPPITIKSVWAGKTPYLVDGQGNKQFEGTTLKDGWIIEKIEDGKVTLLRNRQRLILSL